MPGRGDHPRPGDQRHGADGRHRQRGGRLLEGFLERLAHGGLRRGDRREGQGEGSGRGGGQRDGRGLRLLHRGGLGGLLRARRGKAPAQQHRPGRERDHHPLLGNPRGRRLRRRLVSGDHRRRGRVGHRGGHGHRGGGECGGADRRPRRHGARHSGPPGGDGGGGLDRGGRLGGGRGLGHPMRAEDQRQAGLHRLDDGGRGAVVLRGGRARQRIEAHQPFQVIDRVRRQFLDLRHGGLGLLRHRLAKGGVGGRFEARPGIHRGPVVAAEPGLGLGPVGQVGPVAGLRPGGGFRHRLGQGLNLGLRRGEFHGGRACGPAVGGAEIADAGGRHEGLLPAGHAGRAVGLAREGGLLRRGFLLRGQGQGLLAGPALGLGGAGGGLHRLRRRLGLGAGALQGDALGLQGTLAALLEHRVGGPGEAHRGRRHGGRSRARHVRGDGIRAPGLAHEDARRGGLAVDPALRRDRGGLEAGAVVEDLLRPGLGRLRHRPARLSAGARGALQALAADHHGGGRQPARLGAAAGGAVADPRGAGGGAGEPAGQGRAQGHEAVRQRPEGQTGTVAAPHRAGGVAVGMRVSARCAHGFPMRRWIQGPPGSGGSPELEALALTGAFSGAERRRLAHLPERGTGRRGSRRRRMVL